MSTGPLAFFAVGLILVILGYQTWKNRKVTFLHEYHYKNVKEEDLPAYARAMGIGQIVVGVGLCLTGLLRHYTEGWFSWLPLIASLICGFLIMHDAQKKYNGGWWS